MRRRHTVVCVLRSGGDYDASWVRALRVGLDEHMPEPFTFICLSDVQEEMPAYVIPLQHDWPGWWSKMEIFNQGMLFGGHALYIDLDTLPVGDMTPLFEDMPEFGILRDFLRPKGFQSALMQWRMGGLMSKLYSSFVKKPGVFMRKYRSDQEFIERAVRDPDVIQESVSGIYSYKRDATAGIPPGARLVCGHGQPRFSDPKAGWAHELWKARAAIR